METANAAMNDEPVERRASATRNEIADALEENTQLTKKLAFRVAKLEEELTATKDNTNELLEAFNAVKGGFKVLGALANVLKWLTVVGGFCVFVYGLLHPSTEIKNPLK